MGQEKNEQTNKQKQNKQQEAYFDTIWCTQLLVLGWHKIQLVPDYNERNTRIYVLGKNSDRSLESFRQTLLRYL